MKKLLYTLAFALVAAILVGFTGEANAQLVSPVPLDQVFPTVRDSSFGVPGNYNTQGFAFSFTQDIERCDCRGEFNNVGAAAIQMCLNKLGFTVSQSGHGAPGFETNCVGHKTQVALGSFQQYFGFDESRTNHYGEEDSAYAGMITQAVMNHLCYDIMNDNKVQETTVYSGGGRSSGSRNTSTPEPSGPDVSITKVSDPVNSMIFDGLSQDITYTMTIRNTGDDDLTGIELTDGLSGLSTITCDNDTYTGDADGNVVFTDLVLTENQSVECTATYTVTEVGNISNSASVTTNEGVSDTATSTVQVSPPGAPLIAIEKSVNPTSVEAGQTVTYSFEVCNIGATDLINVMVTDVPINASETIGNLAQGTCVTVTSDYGVQAGDFTNGAFDNNAVATGDNADDPTQSVDDTSDNGVTGNNAITDPVEEQDPTTVTEIVAGVPDIAIEKSVNPTSVEAGQTVTYSFEVCNIGATDLINVMVTDVPINASETIGNLAQGTCVTVTSDYGVQAGDFTNGAFDNNAVATGDNADDPTQSVDDTSDNGVTGNNAITDPVEEQDPTTVTEIVAGNASISIVKSVQLLDEGVPVGDSVSGSEILDIKVSDTVRYSFEVCNTGDVPLTSVEVNDGDLGQIISVPDLPTSGGCETVTFDFAANSVGAFVNEATASGSGNGALASSSISSATIEACEFQTITVDNTDLETYANIASPNPNIGYLAGPSVTGVDLSQSLPANATTLAEDFVLYFGATFLTYGENYQGNAVTNGGHGGAATAVSTTTPCDNAPAWATINNTNMQIDLIDNSGNVILANLSLQEDTAFCNETPLNALDIGNIKKRGIATIPAGTNVSTLSGGKIKLLASDPTAPNPPVADGVFVTAAGASDPLYGTGFNLGFVLESGTGSSDGSLVTSDLVVCLSE